MKTKGLPETVSGAQMGPEEADSKGFWVSEQNSTEPG